MIKNFFQSSNLLRWIKIWTAKDKPGTHDWDENYADAGKSLFNLIKEFAEAVKSSFYFVLELEVCSAEQFTQFYG